MEASLKGRFGGSLRISDFPEDQPEISVVSEVSLPVSNSMENPHEAPIQCNSQARKAHKHNHIFRWKPTCFNCGVKSRLEKKLWIGLACLVFVILGLLISFLMLAVSATNKSQEGISNLDEICMSPECVITAERVMNSMDSTQNPCEDFFAFSCGGWMAKNPIPESSTNWDQFDVLREKMNREIKSLLETEPIPTDPQPVLLAQKLYTMCLAQDNRENHTQMRNLVEKVVGNGEFHSLNDLGTTLGRIRRETNGNFIISMYVFFDEKQPTENTIYIDQQTFGVAIPYLLDTSPNVFVTAYETLIQDLWPLVYPEESNSTQIASELLAFERELAQIATRMENRRNRTALYNPIDLKDLQDILPNQSNWREYFEQIFSETELVIDWNNLTIIVKDTAYFEGLSSVLVKFDYRIIRNYLKWRIIFQFGNAVSAQFQQRIFQYLKVTSGVQYPPPRYKVCSEWVNRHMGWAVSYRYVRTNFRTNFKDEVDSIVKDIRKGFYEILQESDWIREDTKTLAHRKAQAMSAFIAYPKWLLDNREALNQEFQGLLTENLNSNHFDNFVKVYKWVSSKSLRELDKEKDYSKWISYSTVVNAFYSASYNAIAFPAGILQIPFYGYPLQSMNYGGIGAVIGHEITHAFDDEGAQSDEKGRLRNWWDPETLEKYSAKARCFVYQYGNYTVPELDHMPLNGINTQGENIADNGGLRQAFRGYKAYVKRHGQEQRLPGLNFTPDQLFFIGFAQSLCGSYRIKNLQQQILTSRHSPWKFQVKGSVANSVDFALTWKCPIPVYPCQIW
ncbi:unnamed protein product [Allacma fusca]|uniref:Uncharacterized protein n=1 Tax=Allacma fusca TaxID=39272 RepID=A0A8J2Q1J3_9HEXA|nr:unnamed protein product [Allacma fusca]